MRAWWVRRTGVITISLTLVLVAAPLLTSHRVPAYRDAVHFYYPLYAWISACWGRGELPLWNPQLGTGVPVVADVTTAVFYPAKLVFALPLPFAPRFNLYICMHLALAALATYIVARRWRRSRAAATMAAMSYALSGAVLFQYCNVVFLVGAAWLPIALACTDYMVTHTDRRGVLALAVTLALMTLGGDPQMAYHAGLFAVLYAWLVGRTRRDRRAVSGRRAWRPWARAGARIVAVSLLAAALAAVQWVPAAEWTHASRRAAHRLPRTLIEAAMYRTAETGRSRTGPVGVAVPWWRAVATGLLGPSVAGTHQRQIYQFSVSPMRFVEFLWPRFSGVPFPENHRWLTAARLEDRVWTPSLYMGLIPFVLGLLAWRPRGKARREKWLSWIVLLTGLASLGWYGPGWLLNAARANLAGHAMSDAVGNGTGGLYWFLVTFMPGYVYFRYPAKLLVCTALGLSLLGAFEFDRLRNADRRRRFIRWLVTVSVVSLAGCLLLVAARPWWATWFRDAPPDELFGPLDAAAAWSDAARACVHGVVVSAIAGLLLWWPRGRRTTVCYVLVGLTACDLVVANRWMVLTAPSTTMSAPSVLSAADFPMEIPAAVRRTPDSGAARSRVAADAAPAIGSMGRLVRIYRSPDRRWVPRGWLRKRSIARGATTVEWDRRTLLPNLHLLDAMHRDTPRGRFPAGASDDHGPRPRLPSGESTPDASRFPRAGRRAAIYAARVSGQWANITARVSIVPNAYDALLGLMQEPRSRRLLLDVLGVRYLLLPATETWPSVTNLELVAPRRGAVGDVPGIRVWHNPAAFPRAWVVHESRCRTPLDGVDPVRLRARMRDLLLTANGTARDLRRVALVESPPAGTQFEPQVPAPAGRRLEACAVLRAGVNDLSLDVSLETAGLVVVSDMFCPGWVATAVSDSGTVCHPPVVRVNYVMRAVALPAGSWRLDMRYQPRIWYGAAVTSVIAWLSVFVFMVCARRHRRGCAGWVFPA